MATSADYGRDLLMPKEYFGQGRCEDVSVGQNGSLQDVHIVRQTYTCRTETLYSHCLTPADKHNLSPSLIPCLVLSLTLLLSQKHTHTKQRQTLIHIVFTHIVFCIICRKAFFCHVRIITSLCLPPTLKHNDSN